MARRATIEMSARVSEEEFLAFREAFPQRGAVQWFIETALRTFNQRVREEPALRVTVEDAIDTMIEVSKAIAQVNKDTNGKE